MSPITETTSNAVQRSAEQCKNCGRYSEWVMRGDFGGDEVGECAECGGLTYRGVVNSSVSELYAESYFNGAEYSDYSIYDWAHTINFRSKIGALLSAEGAKRQWRVLELGAATGEFCLALRRHKGVSMADYLGVEVSDYARSVALKRGLDVISPFDSEYVDRVAKLSPNLIVAWDVWEHLENPAELFRDLFKLADSELTVALSTVDYSALVPQRRGVKWRQYHPPTHLNYPTRESFRAYFIDLGFKIREQRSEGQYRPLVEYLNCLLPKGITALFRPIHRVPLYLNTYDTQLVIATNWGDKGEK